MQSRNTEDAMARPTEPKHLDPQRTLEAIASQYLALAAELIAASGDIAKFNRARARILGTRAARSPKPRKRH